MKITVAFEKPTYFRDTYHKLKNKLSDSEYLQCIGPRTVGSVMTNRLLKLPSSSSNWPIPPALGTLPYTPCTPWCPDVTFVDSPMVSIAAQVHSTMYYIHSDRLFSGHCFSGNDRFCRRKPLTTQFYLLTVESPI